MERGICPIPVLYLQSFFLQHLVPLLVNMGTNFTIIIFGHVTTGLTIYGFLQIVR